MGADASDAFPAAHPVHAAEPEPVLKVPGVQVMHSWYVPENPGLHAHSEISVLPAAGVEEFCGHCLQRVVLFVAYEAASHLHDDTCTFISCKYIAPSWTTSGLSVLLMHK